jgi:hypothetical protein
MAMIDSTLLSSTIWNGVLENVAAFTAGLEG